MEDWLTNNHQRRVMLADNISIQVVGDYFPSEELEQRIDMFKVPVSDIFGESMFPFWERVKIWHSRSTRGRTKEYVAKMYLSEEVGVCLEAFEVYLADSIFHTPDYYNWRELEEVNLLGYSNNGWDEQTLHWIQHTSQCDKKLVKLVLEELVNGEHVIPSIGKIQKRKNSTPVIKLNHDLFLGYEKLFEVKAEIDKRDEELKDRKPAPTMDRPPI